MTAGCNWTSYFFFFFQAEDGIRDGHVTGVQTCALPISIEDVFLAGLVLSGTEVKSLRQGRASLVDGFVTVSRGEARSEERRVGKECRSRWAPDHEKKKRTKAATRTPETENNNTRRREQR